jgi:hypothetical protein
MHWPKSGHIREKMGMGRNRDRHGREKERKLLREQELMRPRKPHLWPLCLHWVGPERIILFSIGVVENGEGMNRGGDRRTCWRKVG